MDTQTKVDLQAQASCTTWLETAAAQKGRKNMTTPTEKYQLVRLVSNAISNTWKHMTTVRPRGRNLCVRKAAYTLHITMKLCLV